MLSLWYPNQSNGPCPFWFQQSAQYNPVLGCMSHRHITALQTAQCSVARDKWADGDRWAISRCLNTRQHQPTICDDLLWYRWSWSKFWIWLHQWWQKWWQAWCISWCQLLVHHSLILSVCFQMLFPLQIAQTNDHVQGCFGFLLGRMVCHWHQRHSHIRSAGHITQCTLMVATAGQSECCSCLDNRVFKAPKQGFANIVLATCH